MRIIENNREIVRILNPPYRIFALELKKNEKKVAFKVIDFRSFLTYIWRGIYKHESINTKHNRT